MTKICELLLMLDAALVLLFLCMGWNQWPLVITYWAILTARNLKIVMDHQHQKHSKKETA